jgi:EpsD family peptidyl-prolyl cis-trans isomerase
MVRALFIAALCVASASCKPASVAPDGGATVLARVNGAAISAANPGPTGAAGLRESLERVIDRELLVQRALELRLDRDAAVVASLDAARRRILAQAYLDTLAVGAVSRDEIHAFYAENPSLFAQRRIYRLRELMVSAPAELVDSLAAEATRTPSLEDVAAWLEQREARFSRVSLSEPAEELPLAYLPRLARMKDGELAVFPRPAYAGFTGGASVILVEHAEEAPLSEAQAQPVIERFLAARRRLEVAAAEVRRLRAAARIEYVGANP